MDCFAALAMTVSRIVVPVNAGTTGLPPLLHRGRQLFGAVALGHIDHGGHWCCEFVDVADVGEIPLRYPAKRFGRDAVEQDQAEIRVLAAARRTGFELFPA